MTDLHAIAEKFLRGMLFREGDVTQELADLFAQVDADARRDELENLLTLTENSTEARPHGEWEEAWVSCQDWFKLVLRNRISKLPASQERLEE